jgi:hypothetical protein
VSRTVRLALTTARLFGPRRHRRCEGKRWAAAAGRAPPWYTIPPSGYGGIEGVVALLTDGLTDRGHEVTLFTPPGSRTEARLAPPQDVPPEERPLV